MLTDSQDRTGYIASNYQFQFDGPPQAGAIYTSGFSACSNGSLALGGSAVFYECDSGDFFNLYDRSWAAQCSPVEIIILPCGGNAAEAGDGQVVGTEIVTTTIVSALSDGQPQVKTTTTGVPVCQVSQISDGKFIPATTSTSPYKIAHITPFPGQVQVGTTPCASITTTMVATSTLAPVSQYSDGQIQVTPAASVPTVSSVVVTPTAAASESGSEVTLPTETAASTLATSVASGTGSEATPSASETTSAASSATSAPATAGAGRVATGSMAALMVGMIGAVAFL